MFGRAGGHEEFVLSAVAAALARRGVGRPFAVAQAKVWAGFFVALAPTAEADHFVVGGPFGERVVSGVDGNEAAAVFHVVFEVGFGFVGPRLAVVI
jgi:hypothetical protein